MVTSLPQIMDTVEQYPNSYVYHLWTLLPIVYIEAWVLSLVVYKLHYTISHLYCIHVLGPASWQTSMELHGFTLIAIVDWYMYLDRCSLVYLRHLAVLCLGMAWTVIMADSEWLWVATELIGLDFCRWLTVIIHTRERVLSRLLLLGNSA